MVPAVSISRALHKEPHKVLFFLPREFGGALTFQAQMSCASNSGSGGSTGRCKTSDRSQVVVVVVVVVVCNGRDLHCYAMLALGFVVVSAVVLSDNIC